MPSLLKTVTLAAVAAFFCLSAPGLAQAAELNLDEAGRQKALNLGFQVFGPFAVIGDVGQQIRLAHCSGCQKPGTRGCTGSGRTRSAGGITGSGQGVTNASGRSGGLVPQPHKIRTEAMLAVASNFVNPRLQLRFFLGIVYPLGFELPACGQGQAGLLL